MTVRELMTKLSESRVRVESQHGGGFATSVDCEIDAQGNKFAIITDLGGDDSRD